MNEDANAKFWRAWAREAPFEALREFRDEVKGVPIGGRSAQLQEAVDIVVREILDRLATRVAERLESMEE